MYKFLDDVQDQIQQTMMDLMASKLVSLLRSVLGEHGWRIYTISKTICEKVLSLPISLCSDT